MNHFAKEVISVNFEDELKRSYLDYAMSVIIGRALPDVRDGLKPVHRRILFAMHKLSNDWNKSYKKSARIVGDVIGKYHPHGDTAVYDTIVRMAQSFSLRYLLIDGQGNFGSIDGDAAAAMRYTEIRMTKIAHELLTDLDKETVNYTSNYDGTEQIPDVLPTRIPNLLINGSSGIAVGMATNIPPHNLTEVINGCLAYINNENISIENLMQYIPGPDFPTAAVISDSNSIKTAYLTGRSKIYIRARAEIKTNSKTNHDIIIVYSIPYQVNKSRLLKKIAELIKEKQIEGISSVRDESDKDGMRIVIETKRDVVGKVILNQLYALTQMQTSFGINMVALHKGQPKILSLKDILSAFIQHRREVVTRRTIFDLQKTRERAHILEALAIALENINIIIKLIKESDTVEEAKLMLISNAWNIGKVSIMLNNTYVSNVYPDEITSQYGLHNEKYYLTDKQAQAILDLRLQKMTHLEHEKLFDTYKKLLYQINELTHILCNSEQLMNVIRNELYVIKEQYSDIRRTEISSNLSGINVEDMINQEYVVITLSYQGYIKYHSLKDYDVQRRGGKGKSTCNTKKQDFIHHFLIASTHDTIFIFSSQGKIYWTKVYQLPKVGRGARGWPISNILSLDDNEDITGILSIRQYEEKKYICMATYFGIVKKISLIDFHHTRSTGMIVINLHKYDKLIGATITNGDNDIMLFSSFGRAVRFSEKQVRNMGRIAIGVRGIKLTQGDHIVSITTLYTVDPILTVTQYGYGKRTVQEEYPKKSRGTKGIIAIKVNQRNGTLIGALQVNDHDQIMLITNTGALVRIRVSEISIIGRNTQGVSLIRTIFDEYVVGLQRIPQSCIE